MPRTTTDNDVKLALINQVSSVLKWLISCGLLAWFIWVAKIAAVEMSDDSYKPAWERIASMVITAIVTLAAPSGLFWIMWKHLYPLLRKRLDRIAELEQTIDPRRTSSEPQAEGPPPPTTGEPVT